jgi:hypothetical protein
VTVDNGFESHLVEPNDRTVFEALAGERYVGLTGWGPSSCNYEEFPPACSIAGEEEFREATGHGGAMGYRVTVIEGRTTSVRFDVMCN